MEKKGNILDYRRKLENTLTSPDLTNDEMIYTLVKNQILQSSTSQSEDCNEYVVKRRSKEVSDFLGMLRSASVNAIEKSKSSDSGWKVKEDTEEFRVMYRGLEGTPFHTLLVEGYVDGPVDVCLCISCEADLYKKWWPQSTIPAFKVVSSQCLQRIRTGEHISLVRMNSWPLAIREAIVHYFTFEYFQDGLVVVILNSISDSETIDKSTHGFTRDGIPDADGVVRIDLVGGFAIQKVSPERSYFRTIANMDIKLDLAPPSFINFISRQLIASGFRLYKKEVGSVSKGDVKFLEALKDPMYTRIHKALYSENTYTSSPLLETLTMLEEQSIEASEVPNEIEECEGNHAEGSESLDEKFLEALKDPMYTHIHESLYSENTYTSSPLQETSTTLEEQSIEASEVLNEIEECEGNHAEGSESSDYTMHESCDNLTNELTEKFDSETGKKVCISSKVEQALETLETAISILREYNNTRGKGQESDANRGNLISTDDYEEKSNSLETDKLRRNNGIFSELSRTEQTEMDQCEDGSSPFQVKHIDLNSSSADKRTGTTKVLENDGGLGPPSSAADANNSSGTKRSNIKSMFCCLYSKSA